MISTIASAEILTKTLPNQMRLVVVEDHAGPAVFIRVLFPKGDNDDPSGRAGLADLRAALVQKGAGSRNSVEMAELVDWMGAELVGYTDAEYTVIGCNVLSHQLDTGLELVRDMIFHPRFDKGELDLLREQEIGSIKAQRSNPSYLCALLLPPAVFGPESPQGKVKTEESLGKITTSGIASFHKESIQGSQAIALVIGDVEAAKVSGQLAGLFESIPAGVSRPFSTDMPENLAPGKILETDKSDLTQTTVLIGKPGPSRLSPDYYPLLIANYSLGGGGFVSRLMRALRSKEGKTYGVRSSISSSATPDLLTIKYTTRNEELVDSLRLTLSVLRRFAEEGPTDTELSEAKEFYKGYFYLQTETPAQRASKMLAYLFYGLGLEELDRYADRIESVTRDAARRAARQYLTADRLTFSMCGPGKILEAARGTLRKE